ncbi:MAG: NADH-quinone oxidoreductase subunit M [Bacteroidia bacterium]|nr:NADH-quinone oxidoreductase subunit M [Bacteroidia bacterium]MDW8235163.1 NADH-quinone oxidoreductase subunit M [Bacteroidia bacterium]
MIVFWILVPFVGALAALLLPRRIVWQIAALLQVSVGLWMVYAYYEKAAMEVTYYLRTLSYHMPWWGYQTGGGWLSRYKIALSFGVDGTALWMGLAASLVGAVLSFWSSWNLRQPRLQLPAFLLVQGFALWTFFSYDLIAFYVGFEAGLLPMYYLILTLGEPSSDTRRTAQEFLLYTILGSLPMLVGILYGASEISRVHSVPFTTHYQEWLQYPLPPDTQLIVYLTFVLAFWVKLGLFPLHGWMLSLYRHVPLAGVVLSSAILTKMGGIGWLRWLPAMPHGHFYAAPYIGVLSVVSLLGAGLAAYFQKHLREWLALSSTSHLSMVALGLAATSAAGHSGAAWFMVSHALLATLQLLLVAFVITHTGTDQIDSLGGLAQSMPQLTALWVLAALASVGVPGLSQFPGELLIFTGAYTSFTLRRAIFIAAVLGIVVSAVYTIPVLRKVLFGTPSHHPADLPRSQVALLWSIGSFVILTGFIAGPFLVEIQRTTTPLVEGILWQVLGIKQ